jgi:beta-phosphoglucomutase
MIRLICLDLDNTLAELSQIHFRALNMALAYTVGDIIHPNERSEFEGLPTLVKLDKLAKSARLDPTKIKEVNRLKQVYTLDLIEEGFPRYREYEVIEALDARGYKLSCCSNSIRSTVELVLGKLHLNKFITHVVSNEDVDNPKPSPECYLKAMDFWNVCADETLIVEDNANGILSALRSKAFVLPVSDPDCFRLPVIQNYIRAIENL